MTLLSYDRQLGVAPTLVAIAPAAGLQFGMYEALWSLAVSLHPDKPTTMPEKLLIGCDRHMTRRPF